MKKTADRGLVNVIALSKPQHELNLHKTAGSGLLISRESSHMHSCVCVCVCVVCVSVCLCV
jgi:hypothetical protein